MGRFTWVFFFPLKQSFQLLLDFSFHVLVMNQPPTETTDIWTSWSWDQFVFLGSDKSGNPMWCSSLRLGSWGVRQDRVCLSSFNLPGEVLSHYQLFIKPSTAHQRDQRTCFFMNVSSLCSAALLELTWHTASHAYSIPWNGTCTAQLFLAASVETFASRLHWTLFLSPGLNGDSFFAFSTAMTRGSRYIFLGPRRLCLSRPYLMWISRVPSGETDLWLSPWQAVQKGNDLKSILARYINISICQRMSNLL